MKFDLIFSMYNAQSIWFNIHQWFKKRDYWKILMWNKCFPRTPSLGYGFIDLPIYIYSYFFQISDHHPDKYLSSIKDEFQRENPVCICYHKRTFKWILRKSSLWKLFTCHKKMVKAVCVFPIETLFFLL